MQSRPSTPTPHEIVSNMLSDANNQLATLSTSTTAEAIIERLTAYVPIFKIYYVYNIAGAYAREKQNYLDDQNFVDEQADLLVKKILGDLEECMSDDETLSKHYRAYRSALAHFEDVTKHYLVDARLTLLSGIHYYLMQRMFMLENFTEAYDHASKAIEYEKCIDLEGLVPKQNAFYRYYQLVQEKSTRAELAERYLDLTRLSIDDKQSASETLNYMLQAMEYDDGSSEPIRVYFERLSARIKSTLQNMGPSGFGDDRNDHCAIFLKGIKILNLHLEKHRDLTLEEKLQTATDVYALTHLMGESILKADDMPADELTAFRNRHVFFPAPCADFFNPLLKDNHIEEALTCYIRGHYMYLQQCLKIYWEAYPGSVSSFKYVYEELIRQTKKVLLNKLSGLAAKVCQILGKDPRYRLLENLERLEHIIDKIAEHYRMIAPPHFALHPILNSQAYLLYCKAATVSEMSNYRLACQTYRAALDMTSAWKDVSTKEHEDWEKVESLERTITTNLAINLEKAARVDNEMARNKRRR